ncbi:MAG: PAS domain-containing protein [Deltaproteobacteria bacterium]|nr:PAS domain-containing protein [Deltaproteobacteria bacterium]
MHSLEVLPDSVPVVLFTIGANGIIAYSAGQAPIPASATAVDLVGCSYSDAYQAVPWLLHAVERAFGGEVARAVAPVGDAWIEVRVLPEREGDRIVGVVGLSVDVTEPLRSESLLRAAIDSTADGILVVDRGGRVTLHNRQFSEMWQIPAAVLEAGDDERLLQLVIEQLQDPLAFMDRVRDLYADAERESFDVIHFKDGRYFERVSKPQRLEGRVVGRVWSFRDVTQRKSIEDALHQAIQIRDDFLSTASHELSPATERRRSRSYTEGIDHP